MSRINTGPYHNQKQVKLAIHVHYTVSNKESSYAITQELATQVPRGSRSFRSSKEQRIYFSNQYSTSGARYTKLIIRIQYANDSLVFKGIRYLKYSVMQQNLSCRAEIVDTIHFIEDDISLY